MKNHKPALLTFLALPLAFVGIPIYLNIADFYARKFAIDLTTIGLVLIFVRCFDIAQDLFVGVYSDHLASKKISRQKIVRIAAVFLTIGFYLTFNPPYFLSSFGAVLWFIATLSLTYLSFNFIVINLESALALEAKNDEMRVKLNSFKEFFGLIGMILAFILPGVATQIFGLSQEKNYVVLSLIFGFLLILGSLFFKPQNVKIVNHKLSFKNVLSDKKFRYFACIILINSIAVSLPAANMNFYVRDVLQAPQILPWSLSIYFLAACIFIPLWKYSFEKFGINKTWMISIAGSLLVFFLAYFLNSENSQLFYLVCFFSGLFLGADLIAIPTILAQITQKKSELTSSYFAFWNLISKISLVIAASGSLIILGFFGYTPSNIDGQNLHIISFFYAALPCFLKTIVISLIYKFPKYEN